ncbi:unnamed protein product [Brugia timori]|uniref:Uncharacterized protein n=1 Tax=Brugia timori TaxID=42155 RepID=A0A0R3RB61_9BILA|nr:unnamed protein product [Brugia timori]
MYQWQFFILLYVEARIQAQTTVILNFFFFYNFQNIAPNYFTFYR